MAQEIEHKFLVRDDSWRKEVYRSMSLRQGYLVSDRVRSVRVRIADGQAHLNIKSGTLGVSRSEYEYEIPPADAQELLDHLCSKPLLEKTRHLVRYGDHVWEIDVFEGDNAGLVVAEIELAGVGESFARPPWLGEEVSHDPRYYNSQLARHPYKAWQ
ncbi:MAG: CYTH domain-containing protein [Candidatus Competibacteraceae bacterium]